MQTIRLNEIEVCKSYERYTPNINITILKTLRYVIYMLYKEITQETTKPFHK